MKLFPYATALFLAASPVLADDYVALSTTATSITGDISFDDSNILAKDLEEGLLWRDMNNDLVNQIMRRLTIIKPKNPDEEDDE